MKTFSFLLPSRTIWTNILIAAVCFSIPGAEAFIRHHPVGSVAAVNVLNVWLRYLTHRRYLKCDSAAASATSQ